MVKHNVDLVVIEGMGRTLHTNLHAKMKCECLKLAVVKNRWLALRLGGDMYAVICKYEKPSVNNITGDACQQKVSADDTFSDECGRGSSDGCTCDSMNEDSKSKRRTLSERRNPDVDERAVGDSEEASSDRESHEDTCDKDSAAT